MLSFSDHKKTEETFERLFFSFETDEHQKRGSVAVGGKLLPHCADPLGYRRNVRDITQTSGKGAHLLGKLLGTPQG